MYRSPGASTGRAIVGPGVGRGGSRVRGAGAAAGRGDGVTTESPGAGVGGVTDCARGISISGGSPTSRLRPSQSTVPNAPSATTTPAVTPIQRRDRAGPSTNRTRWLAEGLGEVRGP